MGAPKEPWKTGHQAPRSCLSLARATDCGRTAASGSLGGRSQGSTRRGRKRSSCQGPRSRQRLRWRMRRRTTFAVTAVDLAELQGHLAAAAQQLEEDSSEEASTAAPETENLGDIITLHDSLLDIGLCASAGLQVLEGAGRQARPLAEEV